MYLDVSRVSQIYTYIKKYFLFYLTSYLGELVFKFQNIAIYSFTKVYVLTVALVRLFNYPV